MIYVFLKGYEGAITKEVEGDNILETVYFGDTEESSDSDKERTKGEALIYKHMYSVLVYLLRRILVLYVSVVFLFPQLVSALIIPTRPYTNCTCRTF